MDDVSLGVKDRVTDLVEGKYTAEGTHGRVCGLAVEGRCLVDLGIKVDDGPAPHGISGMHHMDLATQVDGSVVTEVLHYSVSTTSGCGPRSMENPVTVAPGRYRRLETLANE
jgi:hypothetical protein